jgi:predicted DNA-binding transcriptional regulator YafY
MRADRLVSLALLLQARGRMSARALAAELEVSVRTVYRDIEALSLAGVPVVTESGPGGGCWLLDGYRFPLRGLNADEAEALLTLGVPAVAAELGLADALAAAQEKVRVSAGGPGQSHSPGAPALVHLDLPRWFAGGEAVPWLQTLATAVRERRRVRIGYRRGDRDGVPGTESSRVIEPLGLVNKAGVWYLVATASDHAPQPSVFRVGRVTSALALADAFDRPPGFELAEFWRSWSASFQSSRPKLAVTVRASALAFSVFTEVFGEAVRPALAAASEADERGHREVTLTFEHEAAAVQRLAGFGGEVEVLEPASVRDRLIATARDLLERYRAGG